MGPYAVRRLMSLSVLLMGLVGMIAPGKIIPRTSLQGNLGVSRGENRDDSDTTRSSLAGRLRLFYAEDERRQVKSYTLVLDGRTLIVASVKEDGGLDTLEYYKEGRPEVFVMDRNNDGALDWWELRTSPDEGILARDDDYDGIVDKEVPIAYVTKY